jgi:hypothetical protein
MDVSNIGNKMVIGGNGGGKKDEKNFYEVGSRFKYHSALYFKENWVVEKINGKKITIKQLSLGIETKTYNASYFNKLIDEKKIEIIGKVGKSIVLSDKQVQSILKLKVFREGAINILKEIAFLGAKRCDWRIICNPAFIDDSGFEEFMDIIFH